MVNSNGTADNQNMLRALAATLRGYTPPVPRVHLSNAATDDPTLRLVGERVVLRPLTGGDAGAMFRIASDLEVVRYLPWSPTPSPEAARPYLEEQEEMRRRGEGLGLAVLLRETGEMVGSTQLMNLRAVRGQGEMGYLLDRALWGRGIMTEAARLTLSHAFSTLRLSRVLAFADVDNAGSRRVLEKVGMREWGTELRTVKGERRLYVRYEIYRTSA